MVSVRIVTVALRAVCGEGGGVVCSASCMYDCCVCRELLCM